MSSRLIDLLKAEFPRLVRFVLIGSSSVILVLVLYGLLSRILWPSGPRTPQYAAVVMLVTWLNYEANRHFTFKAGARSMASMGRFASVAVIASGMNATLFWIGNDVLHVWDFAVIIVNAAIVSIFTFSSHRLFTFHERPWRMFEKKRSS